MTQHVITEVALACGIVSHLSPADDLLNDAMTMARKLAAKPRAALRATKRLLRRSREPLAQRVLAESEQFSNCLDTPAAREALAAFLEKREPDFSKFD